MFHFACDEQIRILLENAQAGAGAEIDAFIVIDGAGIIFWVFEDASAGCFIFWWLCCRNNLSQVSVILFGGLTI